MRLLKILLLVGWLAGQSTAFGEDKYNLAIWTSDSGATMWGDPQAYRGYSKVGGIVASASAIGLGLVPTFYNPPVAPNEGDPAFIGEASLGAGLVLGTAAMVAPKIEAALISNSGAALQSSLADGVRYPARIDFPFTQDQFEQIYLESMLKQANGKIPVLVIKGRDGKQTFLTKQGRLDALLPFFREGENREESYRDGLLKIIKDPGKYFTFLEYAGPPPELSLQPTYLFGGTAKLKEIDPPAGITGERNDKIIAEAYEKMPFARALVGTLHARKPQAGVASLISTALESKDDSREALAQRRAAADTVAATAGVSQGVKLGDVVDALTSKDAQVQRLGVLGVLGVPGIFDPAHGNYLEPRLLLARGLAIGPAARRALMEVLKKLPYHPEVEQLVHLYVGDRDPLVAQSAYDLLKDEKWNEKRAEFLGAEWTKTKAGEGAKPSRLAEFEAAAQRFFHRDPQNFSEYSVRIASADLLRDASTEFGKLTPEELARVHPWVRDVFLGNFPKSWLTRLQAKLDPAKQAAVKAQVLRHQMLRAYNSVSTKSYKQLGNFVSKVSLYGGSAMVGLYAIFSGAPLAVSLPRFGAPLAGAALSQIGKMLLLYLDRAAFREEVRSLTKESIAALDDRAFKKVWDKKSLRTSDFTRVCGVVFRALGGR